MQSGQFHLAFPFYDLEKTKQFYQHMLNCEVGRESANGIIFNFFGNQIVAQKVDEMPEEQKYIYPRHFGLVFDTKENYDDFLETLKQKNIDFYIESKIRNPGQRIEHHTFFLKDPSNNLLEFKYYTHQSAIFNEKESHTVGEHGS